MRTTHPAAWISIAALSCVAACVTAGDGGPDDPGDPGDPGFPLGDPPAGPPPPPTPGELGAVALANWVECLRLQDFLDTNMAPGWSGTSTQTGGLTCGTCHANGAYGFIATGDAPAFFDAIKTNHVYLRQFFTVDLGVDPTLVVIDKDRIEKVAVGTAPHQDHPRFDMVNPGMTALEAFYDLTRARLLAGLCAASP